MTTAPDIRPGRRTPQQCGEAFADLHPAMSGKEARLAAEHCLFCHDAPCVTACPTSIDIPMFIRQIGSGNALGAAETILDANILGGMCARVCPTETLCEEACVRNHDGDVPVEIGRLQRFATDALMDAGVQPYRAGAPTGRSVAVVGGGPAGLACAHRLATLGHAVTIYEARDKIGGLNEYGIAAYKTTGGFAQREVDFVLGVGGIEVRTGVRLGRDATLAELRDRHDAVFLGLGLDATNALGIDHAGVSGVEDAVAFIARLRQAEDPTTLPIGRRVVVVGGGMTAIDAAVQARKLGAEDVVVAYRRPRERMGASRYEQELAQTEGVLLRFSVRPHRLVVEGGALRAVELMRTAEAEGKLVDTGEVLTVPCDQLFKAIGQAFVPSDLDGSGGLLELSGGRIVVDADRRTSLPGVWAGGDCVADGPDLTVAAVEDGKRAAISIDRALRPAVAAAAE
jgi:glutamate synthase (NADPH/NADH) small chain